MATYELCACDETSKKFNRSTHSLNELTQELSNDKKYYAELNSDNSCVFYGECDWYEKNFDVFCNSLINFLKQYYNIEITIDDISYTQYDGELNTIFYGNGESIPYGKVGSIPYGKVGSYRFTIPKLHATNMKQNDILTNFGKKIHAKMNKGVDEQIIKMKIFRSNLYRYPNQTKLRQDGESNRYFIKRGNMIDFVVERIPDWSICIENNEYNTSQKNHNEVNKNTILFKYLFKYMFHMIFLFFLYVFVRLAVLGSM